MRFPFGSFESLDHFGASCKAHRHVRIQHVFRGTEMHTEEMEKEQPSHQSKEDIAGSRCAELQAHEKYLIITISESK